MSEAGNLGGLSPEAIKAGNLFATYVPMAPAKVVVKGAKTEKAPRKAKASDGRSKVPYVRGKMLLKTDPAKYQANAEKSAKSFIRMGFTPDEPMHADRVERVTNLGYLGPERTDPMHDVYVRMAAAEGRKAARRKARAKARGWVPRKARNN